MGLSFHREFIGDETGIERQSLLRPFTDPHGLRGTQYGGQCFRSRNGKLVILMEFLPAPPGSAETHRKISGKQDRRPEKRFRIKNQSMPPGLFRGRETLVGVIKNTAFFSIGKIPAVTLNFPRQANAHSRQNVLIHPAPERMHRNQFFFIAHRDTCHFQRLPFPVSGRRARDPTRCSQPEYIPFRPADAQCAGQRENSLFCSFFIEKTENGVKLHGLLFGEEVM